MINQKIDSHSAYLEAQAVLREHRVSRNCSTSDVVVAKHLVCCHDAATCRACMLENGAYQTDERYWFGSPRCDYLAFIEDEDLGTAEFQEVEDVRCLACGGTFAPAFAVGLYNGDALLYEGCSRACCLAIAEASGFHVPAKNIDRTGRFPHNEGTVTATDLVLAYIRGTNGDVMPVFELEPFSPERREDRRRAEELREHLVSKDQNTNRGRNAARGKEM